MVASSNEFIEPRVVNLKLFYVKFFRIYVL